MKISTELGGKLVDLELKTERARTVLQDVLENYFDRCEPEKDEYKIVFGFQRNGIYCDIVDDYLHEIERLVKDIREAME